MNQKVSCLLYFFVMVCSSSVYPVASSVRTGTGIAAGVALTGSAVLVAYQVHLSKQISDARQKQDYKEVMILQRKKALVKKYIATGVGTATALALVHYLSRQQTDVRRDQVPVLDQQSHHDNNQQPQLTENDSRGGKQSTHLSTEEQSALLSSSDEQLREYTDNYIGLLDDLETQIQAENDFEKKSALQSLLNKKKNIIVASFDELKKRSRDLLQKKILAFEEDLEQLDGAGQLTFDHQLKKLEKKRDLALARLNFATFEHDVESVNKYERESRSLDKEIDDLYKSVKEFQKQSNSIMRTADDDNFDQLADFMKRKRERQQMAKERLKCLPGDEEKIFCTSLVDLRDKISLGKQYLIRLAGNDEIVYKVVTGGSSHILKIKSDGLVEPVPLTLAVENNGLCTRFYPEHKWKVYIAATASVESEKTLKDIVTTYSSSKTFDVPLHLGYLEKITRGIHLTTNHESFDQQLSTLMNKARTVRQQHGERRANFYSHNGKIYAGEGPLVLTHHPVTNTLDSACVGLSIAYSLTHREYEGASIAHVLANHFLSERKEVDSFLTTLGGNKALVFDKSVQSCADLTGRPVFVWQKHSIQESRNGLLQDRYTLRPYDRSAKELGGCRGANLFLPAAGIRYSFDKAIHLFLICWQDGGAHCEVLDSSDFTLDDIIDLNLQNAKKIIAHAREICNTMPSSKGRYWLWPIFQRSAMTQNARIHLELYIEGLLSKYSLADKTMIENLTTLFGLDPLAIEHVYECAFSFVNFCIDELILDKSIFFDSTNTLLLWKDLHYKWFSLLRPADVQKCAYRFWRTFAQFRLNSDQELIENDDLTDFEFFFDKHGFPLLLDKRARTFSTSELSDAIAYALDKHQFVPLGEAVGSKYGEEAVVARAGAGQFYLVPGDRTVARESPLNAAVLFMGGGFAKTRFYSSEIPILAEYLRVDKKSIRIDPDYAGKICLWRKKKVGKELLPGLDGVIAEFNTQDTVLCSINFLLEGDSIYPLYSGAHAPCIPARLLKSTDRARSA